MIAVWVVAALLLAGGAWAFLAGLHRDPAARWARETGEES